MQPTPVNIYLKPHYVKYLLCKCKHNEKKEININFPSSITAYIASFLIQDSAFFIETDIDNQGVSTKQFDISERQKVTLLIDREIVNTRQSIVNLPSFANEFIEKFINTRVLEDLEGIKRAFHKSDNAIEFKHLSIERLIEIYLKAHDIDHDDCDFDNLRRSVSRLIINKNGINIENALVFNQKKEYSVLLFTEEEVRGFTLKTREKTKEIVETKFSPVVLKTLFVRDVQRRHYQLRPTIFNEF
jgi:hypothetical protein